MNKNLRMILFLMITATICTLILSTANYAFEKASEIFNIRLYKAILDEYEIPVENEEAIKSTFLENFDKNKIGNTIYYISKTKNKNSVVFKAEGPGLWSRIEILIAVDANFENMLWLDVQAQAETPGLGGRISEEEFQNRFNGVEIRPELKIVKFASGSNEVDAVTGASMTSNFLEKIINTGIKELDQAFGREKN